MNLTPSILAASLLVLAGCPPAPPSPPKTPAAPSAPAVSEASPGAQLAALDPRRPVPLVPMMAAHQKQEMRAHLAAVQGIVDGLARGDIKAVAKAAKQIGSSPEMAMQCRHMGAGAEGFTPRALDFHRRADAIVAAANKGDREAVLKATAHTLDACVGCHAAYKQQVVDPATWQKRTGEAPPMGAHAN